MEITGKIIAVLPANSGVSNRTGNPWMSQEYVIETHDQYPKKMCFRVFGEDRIKQLNIQSGEELTVSFDVDAHEYNGRWFNQINAWQVNRVQPQQPADPQSAPVPPVAGPQPAPTAPFPTAPTAGAPDGGENNDDLPF